jgi:Kef-type K+ transport system membrane component KefB
MVVHLFVGAALSATSVGITARVLKDRGRLQSPEGQIILGAALLDDVLGLLVLAVVTGISAAAAGGGALSSAAPRLLAADHTSSAVGPMLEHRDGRRLG